MPLKFVERVQVCRSVTISILSLDPDKRTSPTQKEGKGDGPRGLNTLVKEIFVSTSFRTTSQGNGLVVSV